MRRVWLSNQRLGEVKLAREWTRAVCERELLAGVSGYLWGIRTEVVEGQAFPLVIGLQPWDCKSIAKASKVRILHLPPL